MVPPMASTKPADGEAEAGAGPPPVAALAAVELVEDALQLLGRDAGPLVAHLERRRRLASRRPTISIGAAARACTCAALSSRLTSTCSISTKSSESSGRSAGRSSRDAVPGEELAGAAQRGADDVAEVDRLAPGPDGAGLEPRHVEQVVDEAVEPLGLLLRRCASISSRVASS